MSGFISKSSADEFIIGNPQITFFKAVYRRHTNFYIYSKTNIPRVIQLVFQHRMLHLIQQ